MFESIWTGQSILSACTDIYQLHFVRWNKEDEWTPWNTLLLTLDEAETHLKLRNLELVRIAYFFKVSKISVKIENLFLNFSLELWRNVYKAGKTATRNGKEFFLKITQYFGLSE